MEAQKEKIRIEPSSPSLKETSHCAKTSPPFHKQFGPASGGEIKKNELKKETQKEHQRRWRKTRRLFCPASQDENLSCLSLNLKKNREGRAEQEIILTSHFVRKNLAMRQSGGERVSSNFHSY